MSGFTLTELLVVVTIVGILAILAATTIKPWTQLSKARDAQRKSDLKLISTSLESYAGDSGCYPGDEMVNNCGGNSLAPYMNTIPCDPLTKNNYYYVRLDGCNKYALYAYLENPEPLVDYGVGNYAIVSGNITTPPTYGTTPTPIVPTPTSGSPSPIPTPTPTATPFIVPTQAVTPVNSPTPGEVTATPFIGCSDANSYACHSGACRPIKTCVLSCQVRYSKNDCWGYCGTPENPLNEYGTINPAECPISHLY